MTEIHEHSVHEEIVRNDNNPGPMIAGILAAVVLIAFLIWLFAFSGLVGHRSSPSSSTTNVNIQQSIAPQQAPAQTQQQAPAQSPAHT